MVKTDLVSILIPIFHDNAFLSDCLDSILAQTYQNFELLILDRAANKDGIEVVKHYQDDRFFYFAEPLDAQDSIIKLFSLAQGKYIKLFCGDDKMAPNCIEILLKELIANPNYAAVFSSMKTMNHSGKVHEKDILFSEHFADTYGMIESILLNRSHLLYPTVMINRSKIGFDIFDKRFKQVFDVRIWLGIALCYQGEIRCIDIPLVAYRLRRKGGNISDTSKKSVMYQVIYESQQLINFVVEQITPDTIFKVFPKARSVLINPNLKLEKKYLSGIIAVYFLRKTSSTFYGISIAKRFAIDTLFQQMKDVDIERFLSENCCYSLQVLKNDISEYFKENQPSYFKKCCSMFSYYLKKKGLWFALSKTYFYFIR